MRQRSRQIGFFSQQAFLAGSAKIFVDGALRIEVHRVLSIKLNQPEDSLVVCEMEHDSFVNVMVHSRGAADFCRTVVESFTCGVTFVPFPVKGSANKQLPGLTVFLGFDFWIKLDNFGHSAQVLRPVRFNHAMLHNSSYFLALLMSLSLEPMQAKLDRLLSKIPYWFHNYFRAYTTGRGFDRHPSVDYILGPA